MVKMDNFIKLNGVLHEQMVVSDATDDCCYVYDYGRAIAMIENAVVVISDLRQHHSRVFCGRFGLSLGVENDTAEPTIWEKKVLSCMSEQEQDAKFLAELRFYHYLKGLPKCQRVNRYLVAKLRMSNVDGEIIDVLHRMYYIYGADGSSIVFAICVYAPLVFDFVGKSVVVDSISGYQEELSDKTDNAILGRRETQVLSLIERGYTSAEIAEQLSISKHTVNRHRQEILAKLQVKNSIEACRLAKTLGII